MPRDTTSESYFEAKYRSSPDPWDFGSDPYELDRYSKTIAALGDRHYHRAFEPGCSVGILTKRLALICDSVEAMDISVTAVERARKNCSHYPGVSIHQGTLPDDLPTGLFDLIVLSEIGYYFEEKRLADLARQLEQRLTPSGMLLAVHWLGFSKDHVLSGDQVHQILADTMKLSKTVSERYEGFRLESWVKE